jgi:hypothetical protein
VDACQYQQFPIVRRACTATPLAVVHISLDKLPMVIIVILPCFWLGSTADASMPATLLVQDLRSNESVPQRHGLQCEHVGLFVASIFDPFTFQTDLAMTFVFLSNRLMTNDSSVVLRISIALSLTVLQMSAWAQLLRRPRWHIPFLPLQKDVGIAITLDAKCPRVHRIRPRLRQLAFAAIHQQ